MYGFIRFIDVQNRWKMEKDLDSISICRGGNRPGRPTGAYDLAYIKSDLN